MMTATITDDFLGPCASISKSREGDIESQRQDEVKCRAAYLPRYAASSSYQHFQSV